MTTTYKNELKELRDNISDWKNERKAFLSRDILEMRKLKLTEDSVYWNVERIRRDIRIEDAEARILEITGRLEPQISPPESANGYDSNLPSGLADDPGDVTETKTCPHCDGDRISPEDCVKVCHICDGEGIVLAQVSDNYKLEVKQDADANQ